MSQIRIITYNGDGLGEKIKCTNTLNWAKRYKPDILSGGKNQVY